MPEQVFTDINSRWFPDTGQRVPNVGPDGSYIGFLDYYNANAGEKRLGNPLSEVMMDARLGHFIQWYERGRLEFWPENGAEFKIILGETGKEAREAVQELAQARLRIANLERELAYADAIKARELDAVQAQLKEREGQVKQLEQQNTTSAKALANLHQVNDTLNKRIEEQQKEMLGLKNQALNFEEKLRTLKDQENMVQRKANDLLIQLHAAENLAEDRFLQLQKAKQDLEAEQNRNFHLTQRQEQVMGLAAQLRAAQQLQQEVDQSLDKLRRQKQLFESIDIKLRNLQA